MNTILTFEDYKKMNIRQVESVIYHQFIENNINNDNIVSEGFIRDAINKAAGNFIQTALADEIEKGKELEKSIKEALDGLNKGFEEVEKRINTKNVKDPKSKLAAIEKVKEAIKAVQSQAFDTLTMIGSEGEIDFAGFMGSATVAAAANFGILFTPIRSLFITRKAYKYFLGIIKQTIRRNLLIIQLNFDQFENLILQKSFESEDDHDDITIRETMAETLGKLQEHLFKDTMFKSKRKQNELSNRIKDFHAILKMQHEQNKINDKSNPYRSLWQDQYNNTYTRTLEQIKQYINDDSQKELDALKNSITKMAGNDVELIPYGELLIAAAEEYAIHTNHGINNNFIKMSSVFNLDNQKKLIDLIVETEKENKKEINKIKEQQDFDDKKKELEKYIKEGKKIYEEKLKDGKKYTYEQFEEEFGDDIKYLNAFFNSDEGKDTYEEILKENPLYKYYINNIKDFNNLLKSINDLKIIEISNTNDFYKHIINQSQTLYYIMSETSIKNAVQSKESDDFFGVKGISDDDIVGDSDSDSVNCLTTEFIKSTKKLDSKLSNAINVNKKGEKKYFLTFKGSDLFDILHNEFKTEIFKEDKTGYVDDISTENKETIMKLISKNFKLGKSITKLFAEYLIRLEAHMLLKKQNPWFVVKNNEQLFDLDCFEIDSENIVNKNAFVEINSEDYEDIKSFLTKFKNLYENDFEVENTDKK